LNLGRGRAKWYLSLAFGRQILEPAVSWSSARSVVELAAASLAFVALNVEGFTIMDVEGLLDSNGCTGPEEEIGRDKA